MSESGGPVLIRVVVMDLHANLKPVAALVGVWKGPGQGFYPTIKTFDYVEELTFTNIGKPFLHYQQKTWSPTGTPLHTETGYLRIPSPGNVEFILALPTGQTELAEGTLVEGEAGFKISLTSALHNSSSAKRVDATTRKYTLSGDVLEMRFGMAAVGQPMTDHLAATLTRVE